MSVDDGAIVTRLQMEEGPMAGAINRVIGSLSSFSGKLLGTAAVLGFFAAKGLAPVIAEAEKFEVQVAEIAKLVGPEMAKPLSEAISELGNRLPVARKELFNVAEIAARLGIRGTRNITKFTEVMAKMGVATDITSREAADAMARIAKQTDLPIDRIGNLGSVINALSNTMATTTSEVVKNMRRAAPTLARLGLKAEEIAALSASLNEVSESARRAGTRLRRIGQALANPDRLGAFASALGMTNAEFAEMRDNAPMDLLLRLVRAFKENDRAARILASTMPTTVRQALAALAQNLDTGLVPALGRARDEIHGMTSLEEEFRRFADTARSESQVIQNSIDDLQRKVGKDFLTIKKEILEIEKFWLDRLQPLPMEIELDEKTFDRLRDALVRINGRAEGLGETTEESLARVERVIDSIVDRAPELGPPVTGMLLSFIEKSNRAGKSFEEVQSGITLIQRAVSGLIPAMEGGGKAADSAARHLREQIDLYREGAIDLDEFVTFLRDLSSSLSTLEGQTGTPEKITDPFVGMDIGGIIGQFVEFGNELSEKSSVVDNFDGRIRGLAQSYVELSRRKARADASPEIVFSATDEKRLENVKNEIKALAGDGALTFLVDIFEEGIAPAAALAGLEVEQFTDNLESNLESQQTAAEKAEQLKEKIEGLRQGLVEERIELEQGATAAFRYRLEIQGITGAKQDELVALHRTNQERKKEVERLKDAQQAQQRLQERIDRLTFATVESRLRLLEDTVQDLSSGFVDMFVAIADGSENAGQAVVDMINRIARALIESAIQGILLKLLSKSLGIVGGGGAGGSIKAEEIGIDDVSDKFGGFAAKGAQANAGDLFVVGEEGPEFFVPGTNGTITPTLGARQRQGGGDKLTVEVNISNDIRTLDQRGVQQILKEQAPLMAQQVSEQVARSTRLRRNFGR